MTPSTNTLRYMLDTNMVAYARNQKPLCVLERLLKHDPSEICISSITLAELEYGVFNSSKPIQNRFGLLMFLSNITILPFDTDASLEYGSIRFKLRTQGNLIGSNDMLIAAHARALGLTLVTHNTKEFSRVDDLKIEDWVV